MTSQDIFLYRKSDRALVRWDYSPGSFIPSEQIQMVGVNRSPFTIDPRNDGGTDIFWYIAGSVGDTYWDIQASGTLEREEYGVNGSYLTTSGNFLNDKGDDVFWWGDTQTAFWNYHTDNGILTYDGVIVGGGASAAIAAEAAEQDPDTPLQVSLGNDQLTVELANE